MSIVDAKTVKLAPQHKLKYAGLVDELRQLRIGKAVVFKMPQGLSYRSMYQRSATLIDYYELKAPSGFMFSRALAEDRKHMVFTLKPKREGTGRKAGSRSNTRKVIKSLRKIKKLVLKAKAKVVKHKAKVGPVVKRSHKAKNKAKRQITAIVDPATNTTTVLDQTTFQ